LGGITPESQTKKNNFKGKVNKYCLLHLRYLRGKGNHSAEGRAGLGKVQEKGGPPISVEGGTRKDGAGDNYRDPRR